MRVLYVLLRISFDSHRRAMCIFLSIKQSTTSLLTHLQVSCLPIYILLLFGFSGSMLRWVREKNTVKCNMKHVYVLKCTLTRSPHWWIWSMGNLCMSAAGSTQPYSFIRESQRECRHGNLTDGYVRQRRCEWNNQSTYKNFKIFPLCVWVRCRNKQSSDDD